MTQANSLEVLFVCLFLAAGCATSTQSEVDSGCPPGQIRVEDENTDMYDCADRQEYEDMREVMDEDYR
jgi:hypothetical protein